MQRHAPGGLEQRARGLIRNVTIAAELMRERAHVTRALHIVLTAQRIHAHAFAAEIAGRHREVGDAHHHRGALAVLGDAEAIVDGAVARFRIHARGGADLFRWDTSHCLQCFRRAIRMRDERLPFLVRRSLAALGDVVLARQSFGDDRRAPSHSSARRSCPGAAAGDSPLARVACARCAISRGSTTMSFAPWRSRRFSCEANTG